MIIADDSTHLLHDSSFSLRERRVAAQLIVYVLHLNLNASFGFLAVGEALWAGLLARGGSRGGWGRWRHGRRGDVGRCVSVVAESIVGRVLEVRVLQLLVVLLFALRLVLLAVIALVVTLQIVLVVGREVVSRVELLIAQLTLRKVLVKKFR